MRCVHVRRAASNLRCSQRLLLGRTKCQHTKGIKSAGSLFSFCASSSSYWMRWDMSTSQKYCLDKTFSRIWSLRRC
jgi:hypothetical protein